MLRDRLRTAGILIPPAILVLYLGGMVLGFVALVIFTIINYEYFRLATGREMRDVTQLVLVSLLLPFGYLFWGWEGLWGGLLVAIMSAFIIELIFIEREMSPPGEIKAFPAIAVGLLYTGILGTILVILAVQPQSGISYWWLLMTVFLGDTGAYFGGRYFGGRKLSPRISPHKTLSGAYCGLFGAVCGALLAATVVGSSLGLVSLVCFGILTGVLAQIGDLVESMIKRCYEVKDSGQLLPGHGGLLDRFDGVLFAAPILFFLQL